MKDLQLPLPSKLKNRKPEDIKFFQRKAEIERDYLGSLLTPNKAILYTEKGVNKAVKKIKTRIQIQENKLDIIMF